MDNYFALEELLINRLKETVAGVRAILSQAELGGVAEDQQITPALHVIFNAATPTPNTDGHRRYFREQWHVVVAVRNPRTQRGGRAARDEAGPLVTQVLKALELWRPSKAYSPLQVSLFVRPVVSPGGFIYVPLLFDTEHGLPLGVDPYAAASSSEVFMPDGVTPSSISTNDELLVEEGNA